MDSKKLEQLFTPRRKVISGINLGVGASLILIAILFVTYSYTSPVLNPGFYSPAVNSSSESSTAENHVANSDMQASLGLNTTSLLGNLTKEVEDERSKVEDKEGEGILGITQMGNTTEVLMGNGSLHVEESKEMGNVTEKVKEVVFDSGKSTEITTDESLHGEVTEVGNGVGNLSMVVKKDGHAEEAVEGSLSKNTSEVKDDHQGSLNQTKEIVIDFESQSWEGASGIDEKCDIFYGKWVRDDSKPYYPGGSCPLVDKVWNCHANRRPDNDFLKWKWQPNHCDIPSLNATDFLERLRGKRLVFVGDSLNRNMWESLVCILRQSVRNKKKVYEISGKTEFKKKGIYSFRFQEYSCSVDFVVAPFLVRESYHKGKNGSFDTLRLDMMDRTTKTYRDADILVFNTGHWWTHEKTSKGEYYYQEGNYVHPRLKALEAYQRALTTWAKWVDTYINVNKTRVFFRGYSVTHFSGGQWNSGGQCHRETKPIFNETYLSHYPSKMRALEHVLQEMKTPVTYLNISRLTDYRKDGHPSIYRTLYKTKEDQIKAELSQDCSHWCLPGVPDTWNELLYALLLQTGWGSRQK